MAIYDSLQFDILGLSRLLSSRERRFLRRNAYAPSLSNSSGLLPTRIGLCAFPFHGASDYEGLSVETCG